jgi:hypothetical protein
MGGDSPVMHDRRTRLAGAILAVVAVATQVGVAVASAHTPATFQFGEQTATITAKPVGSGATAHHVIDIPGLNTITCTAVEMEGGIQSSPIVSFKLSALYFGCESGGEEVTISMEACLYSFNANGEVSITSRPFENCAQEPMRITTKSGCQVVIDEQTLPGVGYTNINSTGWNPDVTVGLSMTKITGKRGAGCAKEGSFTTGEYTTGNTILFAEQVGQKNLVSMKWSATVP